MAVDTYALTSLTNLKTSLGISVTTWDTQLENAINAASAKVESYIGRRIKSRTYIEHINPDGSDRINLRQYPITTIDYIGVGVKPVLTIGYDNTSAIIFASAQWDAANPDGGAGTLTLKTGQTTGNLTVTTESAARSTSTLAALSVSGFTFTLIENVRADWLHQQGPVDVTQSPMQLTAPAVTDLDVRVDRERGILWRPKWDDEWMDGWNEAMTLGWRPRFGFSPQSMVVQYAAGYATVPYDIEQATIDVAKAIYLARKRDPNVNSESLGDYSYTHGGASRITEILEESLGSWKEIR